MALSDDVTAVRTSVTLASADHLACVRISGSHALDALDQVSPRELFIRPGQMLHTLLLDDDARPIADAYLACDEDDYLVLADGLSGSQLVAYLRRHTAADLDVTFADLTAAHGMLSLDGPYAWELLAAFSTPDVIGLPYLGLFHEGRFVCFRTGQTGEFGYTLLIERTQLPAIRSELVRLGSAFDLREIGLAALDTCALENGFFNVRREARPGTTPLELQLQWRVSYQRTFPGSRALAERRRTATHRSVMLTANEPIDPDAELVLDGVRVGSILNAARSPTRGTWIAVALVTRALAHPGIDFRVGGVEARSVSSPTVNNRSLYVDPQRHSYVGRQRDVFPPLVRP